jgi:phosphatidylserine/phosphatidylglycerophosphate/cardiolipin synthase-like enzyme
MQSNVWNSTEYDEDEAALDGEFQVVMNRIVTNMAKLQALSAPPDPVKAMAQTLSLLERSLKIQVLMRNAYPKRSRLARRNRRRSAAKPKD